MKFKIKYKPISIVVLVLVSAALVFDVYKINSLNNTIKEQDDRIQSIQEEADYFHQSFVEETEGYTALQKEYDEMKEKLDNVMKERDESNDKIDKMLKSVSFNKNDVTQPSGATEYQMKKALKVTGLYSLSPVFTACEEKYHINALFLAAIAALESHWGKSPRALYDNNISGLECFTSSSIGAKKDSKEQCLLDTAQLLSECYVNVDGKYYKGKSISAINTLYCKSGNVPNTSWERQILDIINNTLIPKANRRN